MSQPPNTQLYAQTTGSVSSDVFLTILQPYAPSATMYHYPIGKRWVDTSTNSEYILANLISTDGVITGNWILLGQGTGILSLTGNSGGAVGPDGSNNINTLGDTSSINITGTPSTHTLTANVILPDQYDALLSNGTSIAGASPNTSGFLLTSNGPSALPTFQAAPGVSAASFKAVGTAAQSNVTGNGVVYVIQFPTAQYNIGAGYNAGTGVFTAPYAGTYIFNVGFGFYPGAGGGGITAVSVDSSIQVNGTSGGYGVILPANSIAGDGVNTWISYSSIYNLAAGNTVNVQVTGTGSTSGNFAGVVASTSPYFYFAGCLI